MGLGGEVEELLVVYVWKGDEKWEVQDLREGYGSEDRK